ncbi:MAG: hypothetical protein AB7F82_06365, partial [Alphaproteobacteria bacterium]
MDIVKATLSDNPELVKQYFELRARKHPKKNFPNEEIPGDNRATFMLAVEEGKVRLGVRLNEPDTDKPIEEGSDIKGWLPVDKVKGARLENIFREQPALTTAMRQNSPDKKVLYIDGIFGDISMLTESRKAKQTLMKLLPAIRNHAEKENYAAVIALPEKSMARLFERYFTGRNEIPSVNLGPQHYVGHAGRHRGKDRNLLIFFNVEELRQHVRSKDTIIVDFPPDETHVVKLGEGP